MRANHLLVWGLASAAGLTGACTSQSATSPDTTVPAVMQSAPNVTGVVEIGGVNGAAFRLVTTSDPYFERGSIRIDPRSSVVVSDTGEPINADDLLGGMKVEVWVGACAESSPVQCVAEAIRVVGT